ncbi:hypothetical protein [Sphingomonas sp. Leaf339]|nr:hypothetical protein [Sphingomonas sp. Leaf339]
MWPTVVPILGVTFCGLTGRIVVCGRRLCRFSA